MSSFFRREGVSAIEMLVIVGVIVILSGVTMWELSSMSVSAEARRIIRNLQTLRAATLAWYKDNSNLLNNDQNKDGEEGAILKIGNEKKQIQIFIKEDKIPTIYKYIKESEQFKLNNGENGLPNAGEYAINAAKINGNRKTWFVGYRFFDNGDEELKSKVKDLVKTQGGFHFTDKYAEDARTQQKTSAHIFGLMCSEINAREAL